MAEMMRAGQMAGVNQMACVETPIPEPADGQLLVKTAMASICGSDLHVVCHGAGVSYPFPCPHGYPGHEGIGEVVESRYEGIDPGTKVLCFPQARISEGFSEYQRLAGHYVLPLPECDVSDPELLMAQQLGTVIFAARQRPVDVVGKTVLVMGQGSAGLFWTYWLKRNGAAQVIATDYSDTRLEVSKKYGADVALNVGEIDVKEAVRELAGDGPDYLVEAVGSRETLHQSIELVRPEGDLMWFGLPDTEDSVPINFFKFFRKKLAASSTYGAQEEGDAVSFQTALDIIAGGQIDVKPLLADIYPIEEIQTAFDVANDPVPSGALKVSVTF